MNSKIIIVRIKNSLIEAINYLNRSLETNSEQYYSVNEDDTPVVSLNDGLTCIVAFVVFESCEVEKKDRILRIYVGNGRIACNEVRWVVYYRIQSSFSSSMVINNFISNSELDLKNDFESHSFIIIEDNIELVNQISFITFPPYHIDAIPATNQNYCHLDRENTLHQFSQRNEHCKRPLGIRLAQEYRSEFQRDYERIVHAKAYRRLVDKAQIFTSSKGDHYRTRMTHTLEVAQIARAIAVGLNLNVELTEAIALAHDLGHTPFGHQGERTLDDILKGKINIIKYTPSESNNFYGGFKHNFQGVRVVNFLEEKYIEFNGLDLSYQVLEGILKHTSTKIKDCASCNISEYCDSKCFDLQEFLRTGDLQNLYPQILIPTTLEGQIITIADEIAQRSHDLDDAFASGILNVEQLSNYLSLQKMGSLREPLRSIHQQLDEAKAKNRAFTDEDELRHSCIVASVINFFICDTIQQSTMLISKYEQDDFYIAEHRFNEKLIDFSQGGKVLCDYLEKIISKKVINSSEVVNFDNKAAMIVTGLFKAYYNNPKLLHRGTLRKIYLDMRQTTSEVIDFLDGDREEVKKEIEKIVNTDLSNMEPTRQQEYRQKKKILVRAIADYISGMTDSYAINEYNAIYQ